MISGKGGTGKTSLTASFAVLAKRPVIADCDVDAPDLHLVLAPQIRERHRFTSGRLARIRQEECTGCGNCLVHCRFDAVRRQGNKNGPGFFIDAHACEGCGVCLRFCPAGAIDFPERPCGEWLISETRCGPMVYARLAPAGENSGKMVSTVRREARRIAGQRQSPLILVDGPPGIGCPAIASLTGASLALAVTEPTVSGENDVIRVLALVRHFNLPAVICVNKWDLNPAMADRLEEAGHKAGTRIGPRIRYDQQVTTAQMEEKAVVETEAPSADDIRELWFSLGL